MCAPSSPAIRSASDRSGRSRSGASAASVPKSGLASTATVRSFRWEASRLPTRKVLVVLPTPPFGLIIDTVFARVTPGCDRIRRSMSASSRSPLDTSSDSTLARTRAGRPIDSSRPSTTARG